MAPARWTIVIPYFNEEKWLPATLASLGTLNEFISRYMPSDDVTLILCGGNASALSPHIRHAQIKTVLHAPSLCLLGLKFWQAD